MFEMHSQLKTNRPTLKQSTLKTYETSLRKVYENMGLTGPIKNFDYLRNIKDVNEAVNLENKITTKKNRYTAILTAIQSGKTTDNELVKEYSESLSDLTNKYESGLKNQEKTKSQDKNWISMKELQGLYNNIQSDVKGLKLHTKNSLNKKQYELLQQMVVLRLYLNYPLRNDFADVKVVSQSEYDNIPKNEINKYNYMVDGKKLILHNYKTVWKYGVRTYDFNKQLQVVIAIWLKYNKSGWLLTNSDMKTKMTRNSLGKFLNKLFTDRIGKRIGSSLLRHIQISHDMEGKDTLKEKEQQENAADNKYLNSGKVRELVYRKVD